MTTDNTNDDLPPALPAIGEGEGAEGEAKEAAPEAPAKAPEAPAKQAKAAKAAKALVADVASAEDDDRVTIIVDEPNNSPSSQQFFGLNGKGFLITFGEKVRVPRALLNVLNECVETRSIPQQGGGVVERDSLRFSYRIVG